MNAWQQWHKEIISGGYKRLLEIAKRSPNKLIILDRYPTLFQSLESPNITVLQYGKKFDPKFLYKINSTSYDLLTRIITVIDIFINLVNIHPNKIYVPDSELSHLTLPAVIYKLLFSCKIYLANLNVNTIIIERMLNVFLHKYSDRTITISQDLKANLENSGIKISDVNGVGFQLSKKLKSSKKLYEAIYVGRQIPQKGIFDLIDIWDILVNKYHKKIKLVTIGNTPHVYKNKLQSYISQKKLEKYILHIEDATDSVKWKYLSLSKAMVFPSHQEGWGISPMEALSMGLPVVAYDLSVYKESIGSTEALRIVKEGDKNKFVEELLNTLNNLDQYSIAAKSWKPMLTWDDVADKEWKIINS
jgi:glycosyltransferase involved in cell wall biosynthesis